MRHDAETLRRMPQAELRALASRTPGVSRNKKASKGKWIPKSSEELVAELLTASASTQSLTGGRSSAEKKWRRLEFQRRRQKGEEYKAGRRTRENTEKYKFAKKSRRGQEKYKAKKRMYENSAKAKLSRLQRKAARFWAPCLSNWSAVRSKVAKRAEISTPAFAPRFHADGRVSILQGGLVKYLPCPIEPGRGSSREQTEEFALALHLRCRIGAVSCNRLGPGEPESGNGCSKRLDPQSVQECRAFEKRQSLTAPLQFTRHRLRFGGCVQTGRLRRHTHHCPMQDYTWQELRDSLGCVFLGGVGAHKQHRIHN